MARFSDDAMRRIGKAVRRVERMPRNTLGRRARWQGKGSGGRFSRIFFTIVSVDEYGESAVCQITQRPFGQTVVPEEDEYGQVTVFDDLDCLLSDEEPVALVGRAGTACYMSGSKGYDDSGYSDTDGGHWAMDGLCCPSVV